MQKLEISDIGKLGLIQDIPGHKLPKEAFTTATNIRFRNNFAQKIDGHSRPLGTPSAVPYFAMPVQGLLNMFWLYCGLTQVYVAKGNIHSNISQLATTYGATADDTWTGTLFNGLAIVNNGIDDPQYWPSVDESTLLQDLPAWPASTQCKVIASFKNHVLAFDITDTGARVPHEYRWSHAAETGSVPSSWDYTDATLLAGRNYFSEDGGNVKAAGILNDTLIVYRQWATEQIRYVGFPNILEHKRILNEKEGILSKHCFVSIPKDRHAVLTANDFRVHNGATSQSVIEDRMRDTLFAEISNVYKHRTFLVANYLESEVWICYPEVGESLCTKALIWNYDKGTYSTRALPGLSYATWGIIDSSSSGTINSNTTVINTNTQIIDQVNYDATKGRVLALDAQNTKLLKLDDTNQFDGVDFTGTLQRTGLAFKEGKEYLKKIFQIDPTIEAVAGTAITIKVGYADTADGSYTWGTGQTFTVGTDYKVNFNNDANVGRFLAYEISSTAAFEVHAIAIHYKVAGRK